jgi:hypothetical protein
VGSGKWEDQSVCHSDDRREEESFELEVGRPKKEVLLRVSKKQQHINFPKKHH